MKRKTVNMHRLKIMSIEQFANSLSDIFSGRKLYRTQDGRVIDYKEGKETQPPTSISLAEAQPSAT